MSVFVKLSIAKVKLRFPGWLFKRQKAALHPINLFLFLLRISPATVRYEQLNSAPCASTSRW